MIDQLYQKAILKQAALATRSGKLAHADHCCTVHNPLCGDRITVYFCCTDNQITAFSHETKACVLCQASASILGACIVDETIETLRLVHDYFQQGLAENNLEQTEWPEDCWSLLNIFQPVSDHKSRLGCVTLPFKSLLKAWDENKNLS